MMNSSYKLSLVFALILNLLYVRTAMADEGTPSPSDDEVNAVAKQMFCPVCENIPLDVCGTKACIQWRELIRDKLSQGWTVDQIKAYFVEQYGDRVLSTPPIGGGVSLNWLAYLVPPLILFIGIVIFVRVLRSWKSSTDSHSSTMQMQMPEESSKDEYISRIEEELRRGPKV